MLCCLWNFFLPRLLKTQCHLTPYLIRFLQSKAWGRENTQFRGTRVSCYAVTWWNFRDSSSYISIGQTAVQCSHGIASISLLFLKHLKKSHIVWTEFIQSIYSLQNYFELILRVRNSASTGNKIDIVYPQLHDFSNSRSGVVLILTKPYFLCRFD